MSRHASAALLAAILGLGPAQKPATKSERGCANQKSNGPTCQPGSCEQSSLPAMASMEPTRGPPPRARRLFRRWRGPRPRKAPCCKGSGRVEGWALVSTNGPRCKQQKAMSHGIPEVVYRFISFMAPWKPKSRLFMLCRSMFRQGLGAALGPGRTS